MNQPPAIGTLSSLLNFLQSLRDLQVVCLGQPTVAAKVWGYFRVTQVWETGAFLVEQLNPETGFASAGTMLINVGQVGSFQVCSELTHELAFKARVPKLREEFNTAFYAPVKEG